MANKNSSAPQASFSFDALMRALRYMLKNYGVEADAIHGDKTQDERQAALSAFREGTTSVFELLGSRRLFRQSETCSYLYTFRTQRHGGDNLCACGNASSRNNGYLNRLAYRRYQYHCRGLVLTVVTACLESLRDNGVNTRRLRFDGEFSA